ncbi:hypothetical protein BN903_346 [Halorubrum sp. AJ67]|nr:hypothetical protein BN903_346 [Halorubrum sp. AJ67]
MYESPAKLPLSLSHVTGESTAIPSQSPDSVKQYLTTISYLKLLNKIYQAV